MIRKILEAIDEKIELHPSAGLGDGGGVDYYQSVMVRNMIKERPWVGVEHGDASITRDNPIIVMVETPLTLGQAEAVGNALAATGLSWRFDDDTATFRVWAGEGMAFTAFNYAVIGMLFAMDDIVGGKKG